MAPIDRLTVAKALWLFKAKAEIESQLTPDMSMIEVRQLMDSFKEDFSDWPFMDPEKLGVEVPESEETEPRQISDFEREHCLTEGLKDSIGLDSVEFLKAIYLCHPDTVYGPAMSVVRQGVAEQMSIPPGMASRIRRANDADRTVSAQGENVSSGRTVQLDTSDDSAGINDTESDN